MLDSAVKSNLNLICQKILLVENKKGFDLRQSRVRAVTFIILLFGVLLQKKMYRSESLILNQTLDFGYLLLFF